MRTLPTSLLLLVVLATVSLRAGEPAKSADQIEPPVAGDSLPALTLTTAEGEPFDLAAAVEEKPTILILYRGGW